MYKTRKNYPNPASLELLL